MENNNQENNINNIENTSNDIKTSNFKINKPVIIILAVIAVAIVVFIFANMLKDKNEVTMPTDPEEIQVGLTDFEATDAEIQELSKLNEVLDTYVNTHISDLKLITSYGMLTSLEKDSNISVADITSEGLIDLSEHIGDSNYVDILYIKGSDLGLNSSDLKVATAYNTKNGYYISAKGVEGKYYTEQEYHDLMLKYSFVHGEVTNPKVGDANYTAIRQAVSIDDSYDIKHLACDDKYAVIVANKLSDTAQFIEAVLVKDGDNWKVGIGNLVSSKCAKQDANKNYPDMELGLMPVYNIGDYSGILSDLSTFTSQLVSLGELTEDEAKNAYTCSAGSFAYVQTESGKRLMGCMNSSGKLEFNKYGSLEETISAMVHLQQDPPVFILKFN